MNAGRARLRQELASDPRGDAVPSSITDALLSQGDRRANLAWERLGRDSDETLNPAECYRNLRTDMLESERAKVLKVRDKGVMDHEVLEEVMESLDIEESMINRIEARNRTFRQRLLLTPEERTFACEHLAAAPFSTEPQHPDGCIDCEREGREPVHLRECLTCGYVGCCDSSEGRHATAHHRRTGHPVMRSIEPGEGWRWCYVDQRLG